MSADVLRAAARLMRERAEAIVPDGYGEKWFHPSRIKACLLSWPNREDEKYGAFHAARDAEHIASWSPAVALAVAGWLDREADEHERYVSQAIKHTSIRTAYADDRAHHALTVARAYLGDES